ncbi:MAG: JmjC domain-containing protein, partial [Nocardioidaceae bacterium]
AGGATVVLQGLHRYWPPLTELVRDLELALGHPCQANAYLTPPGSQGFAVHSDSHDVFVFQTSGVKQWEVQDESGSRDVLLEPGVSMYLPTGTPHAARSQDVASLHVTIGINQVTWRDVMGRVVQHVLDDTDEMDAALPAGYLEDRGEVTDGVRDRLELLAARLAHADPEAAADAEVTRFLTSRPSLLRGGLHDLTRLREIDQDTALRRRPGSACVLVPGDDVLRVLLGDRELRVPARLVDPMTYVREQETLRPADLASWLDTDSRLVLARRLVREGLLQVEA